MKTEDVSDKLVWKFVGVITVLLLFILCCVCTDVEARESVLRDEWDAVSSEARDTALSDARDTVLSDEPDAVLSEARDTALSDARDTALSDARDTALSEAPPKELYMTGSYSGGTVKLRWAASSYPLWREMLRRGVVLERYEFDPARPVVPQRTLLTVEPFLQKDTALISAMAEKNEYAAVLGEAVYADNLRLGLAGEAGGGGNMDAAADAAAADADAAAAADSTVPDWASLKVKMEQEAVRFVLANLAYDRSFAVACLGSMGYVDRHLSDGKYYLYRLFVEGGKDTAIFFTRQEKVAVAGSMPIQELEVEMRDGRAHLAWPHAAKGSPCVGYYIERAEGKSRKYTRLNKEIYADFVQEDNRYTGYTDSLPDLTKEYRYRILAQDLFGGERVIAMSHAASNRNVLHVCAEIDSLAVGRKGYTLFWSFPAEAEEAVRTFSVYAMRAPSDVLTGEPLAEGIPAGERSCRIAASQVPSTAYLYVVAEGYEGERKVSLPWFRQEADSIPPAAPLGLSAAVDSMGVLSLSWKPSPEADLAGYRVFFALKPESEPVQLSSKLLSDTVFTDTLTLISPQKFCYGVKAEDKRGNLSDMSEYVMVGNGRPDPPVPAVFLPNGEADEKSVELRWENSPSPNLRGQILQYRIDGGQWSDLKEYVKGGRAESLAQSYKFNFPATYYNRRHEFRILAYGEDRERDTSYSPFIRTVTQYARIEAPRLTLTPDRDRHFIHVQWSSIDRGDIRRIYLYRAEEGGKMLLLACLGGDEAREGYYVDSRVSVSTAYRYKMQVEFSDGTWSEPGTPAIVEY